MGAGDSAGAADAPVSGSPTGLSVVSNSSSSGAQAARRAKATTTGMRWR